MTVTAFSGLLSVTVGNRVMKKKLQVFISSTFLDLQRERQAAVEAILGAGHIPAGMELFAAADESQLQIIYQWIEASDAFMLLLGGRYGSIEEKTGKSYTHLEYEHALAHKKRPFSLVMKDGALAERVKADGQSVIETANPAMYKEFKKHVESRQCAFFSDTKDVKIEIQRAIINIADDPAFRGWVPGPSAEEITALRRDLEILRQENESLQKRLSGAQASADDYQGLTFDELAGVLGRTRLDAPVSALRALGVDKGDLLSLLARFGEELSLGIDNRAGGPSPQRISLLFEIGSKLVPFGLVEPHQLPGTKSPLLRTTAIGRRFLAELNKRERQSPPAITSTHASATGAQRTRAARKAR